MFSLSTTHARSELQAGLALADDDRPIEFFTKYAPRFLNDFIGQDETIGNLRRLARHPVESAILLAGGTGSGKTTVAMAFCREIGIDLDANWLNCLTVIPPGSQTRESIESELRELRFAPPVASSRDGWRVVLLNECSFMHPSVFNFWLEIIDNSESIRKSYPKTIFIFTDESIAKVAKIRQAFVDRCRSYDFTLVGDEAIAAAQAYADRIFQSEIGIDAPDVVQQDWDIFDASGKLSMRRVANESERFITRQVRPLSMPKPVIVPAPVEPLPAPVPTPKRIVVPQIAPPLPESAYLPAPVPTPSRKGGPKETGFIKTCLDFGKIKQFWSEATVIGITHIGTIEKAVYLWRKNEVLVFDHPDFKDGFYVHLLDPTTTPKLRAPRTRALPVALPVPTPVAESVLLDLSNLLILVYEDATLSFIPLPVALPVPTPVALPVHAPIHAGFAPGTDGWREYPIGFNDPTDDFLIVCYNASGRDAYHCTPYPVVDGLRSYRLEKTGSDYDVSETVSGPACCTCPQFVHRLHGVPMAKCKHINALLGFGHLNHSLPDLSPQAMRDAVDSFYADYPIGL